MNSIYHSIWNSRTGTFVAVSEHTRGVGKAGSAGGGVDHRPVRLCLRTLAVAAMLAAGANVLAAPTGGVVTSGTAHIGGAAGAMTINQSSANASINWQSFDIARGESVQFIQPSASSVALNRVLGPNPSSIFGSLSANGKVFLINPNGILFGAGASVNVGSLVASTLNLSDADLSSGNLKFAGTGNGSIQNQGSISVGSGYVALLGANVTNNGVISARLGSVALAGGAAMTLDMVGDHLLNVTVDRGAVNALVQNGGMIRADGGQVLMTTRAAGSLLATAVNNTGLIQAQTIQNVGGSIKLMGDMDSGTVTVGGTIDASAPLGGNGGFIETSAARVNVKGDAAISTLASRGTTGSWLIDPQNFTVGSGATDNISGATLSGELVTNSVIISTALGSGGTVAGTPPVTTHFANSTPTGNGDINVNEAITWKASSNPTTLTLLALGDVNVNQPISATLGNFVVCCGRDVNINSALTAVNGSILLNAGRNANIAGAVTLTDGNLEICAANNINVSSQISLTRGSSIPAQSLNLPVGMILNAGYGGVGPGTVGGTLTFGALTPPVAVTGPNAPVTINYNPVAYTTPTDYLPHFTLVTSTLTQHMLVFPGGADKTFDGSSSATLSSLKSGPAGVTLVAGPGSVAAYTTPDVGVNKEITFTGYSLSGPNAGNFALPISCCAPNIVGRSLGTITAAILPPPPVVVPPPVIVPPPIIAPPATPPPAAPPVSATPAPTLAPPIGPTATPPVETAPPIYTAPPLVGPPLLIVPPPVSGPPVVQLPPPVVPPPVTIVPPEVPPETYIPPVHLRKQDRH